uniref:Intraflagellar transport protein 56 n=1 Tax=Eptatretus burgeri TaxID=7764 RepID=A0A8C4R2E8_EPTBU
MNHQPPLCSVHLIQVHTLSTCPSFKMYCIVLVQYLFPVVQTDHCFNTFPEFLGCIFLIFFLDIMNRKPRLAWELYLQMETSGDSFSLLHIIANDCYKMGQFYFAAKAFDVLERLDSNPEYWEGKRGSCVGALQMIIAGRERKEILRDIVQLLRKTGNPEAEYIVRIVKKWAKMNHLTLTV